MRAASDNGIRTQITVSPCLRYTAVEDFGHRLLESGAARIVIDTAVDGDGSDGARSARTPFAIAEPDWAETEHAHALFAYLCERGEERNVAVGWSNAGFCGIKQGYIQSSVS